MKDAPIDGWRLVPCAYFHDAMICARRFCSHGANVIVILICFFSNFLLLPAFYILRFFINRKKQKGMLKLKKSARSATISGLSTTIKLYRGVYVAAEGIITDGQFLSQMTCIADTCGAFRRHSIDAPVHSIQRDVVARDICGAVASASDMRDIFAAQRTAYAIARALADAYQERVKQGMPVNMLFISVRGDDAAVLCAALYIRMIVPHEKNILSLVDDVAKENSTVLITNSVMRAMLG